MHGSISGLLFSGFSPSISIFHVYGMIPVLSKYLLASFSNCIVLNRDPIHFPVGAVYGLAV